MLDRQTLLDNWAAAAAKLASAKERTVCMTAGEHAVNPQTWKCVHCSAIAAVMKTPALAS